MKTHRIILTRTSKHGIVVWQTSACGLFRRSEWFKSGKVDCKTCLRLSQKTEVAQEGGG